MCTCTYITIKWIWSTSHNLFGINQNVIIVRLLMLRTDAGVFIYCIDEGKCYLPNGRTTNMVIYQIFLQHLAGDMLL